ncbi:sigma 54-interacting transcriptional regulator [Vibrio sp. S11_S32]|uniref:sigma 54-interacting transcriptional regulator n=1 Tax=Vibrio sp. S11_S32 TaxID=2720225 RepID=UPI0016809658|nr:sigma 54-interacting transcriptional regulator [Vibrio sp. S11_S32]MBD1577623.1 sigma 54-interacting transcriptional regulator [Vibrio sp. S11_S32]
MQRTLDVTIPNEQISQFFSRLCSAVNLQDLVMELNTLTLKSGQFQSANILLYNADKKNHLLFYPHQTAVNTLLLDQPDIEPDSQGVQLSEKYTRFNRDAFVSNFPSYSHLSNFDRANDVVHFPLSAFNRYIGKLEVVNVSTASDAFISDLKQVSIVISLILAKIFDGNLNHNYGDQDSLLGYSQSLGLGKNPAIINAIPNKNTLHNHVLVDVTEAVIGQIDFEGLTTLLFRHLHEHFNIEFISIMSLASGSETLCCHEVTQDSDGQPNYKTAKKAKVNTIADHVIETKKTIILGREDYPLLKHKYSHVDDHYVTDQLSSECVLPLLFRQQVLGVIKYGHRDENYFSEDLLDLLQQIAARVAVAINNFQRNSKLIARSNQQDEALLSEDYQNNEMFGDIISQSAVMSDVLQRVLMVADCDSTVLILGETGTGKEMIANMIHSSSHRSRKKMIKMNCSAVPSGLFESDLFGHEKGAFTGAIAQQTGRFEEAHNSTFFLDEIGDMPLDLQPKVLRVLQEGEIERVGNHTVIPVDVRLIAATHCDLLGMVNDKSFRRDLYYRLNVFPIRIPPLRERREDIPLLAKHFTRIFAKKMNRDISSISSETLRVLSSLPWPGNIRELKNVIERAVIMTYGSVLHLPISELQEYFPEVESTSFSVNDDPQTRSGFCCTESVGQKEQACSNTDRSAMSSKKSLECEQIIQVLKETNGIVAGPRGAAQRLGLKRTTLLSRMQRLGITSNDYA